MKKFVNTFVIVAFVLSITNAAVTFNLNTSTAPGFTDTTSTIVIRGSMNSWGGNECDL